MMKQPESQTEKEQLSAQRSAEQSANLTVNEPQKVSNANSTEQTDHKAPATLICPVLPVREIMIFPYTVLPLYIPKNFGGEALKEHLIMGKQVLFLLIKTANFDAEHLSIASMEQLHQIGVVASILQASVGKDETIKLLVEGTARAQVVQSQIQHGTLLAQAQLLSDVMGTTDEQEKQLAAMWAVAMEQFGDYVKLSKKIPAETVKALSAETQYSKGIDLIAAQLQLAKQLQRQKLIEERNLYKRLQLLTKNLSKELELLRVEERIKDRVKQQVNKVQHEYYLNEKLKAVQHELSELGTSGSSGNNVEKLRKRINAAGMPKEAKEKAQQELERLANIPSFSPEAGVIHSYLDWLLALPWKSERPKSSVPNLAQAEAILTKEHYGLEKVNERILEYLAVQMRSKCFKGPILCLVGPPGVGKTSLGESIARATGRAFIRLSLGGIRDEAEIRGHRRTYLGAMPGRIIQKIAKAKSKNPLFMLDEIDKLVSDYHGDPAAALLEVLDPEQNRAFDDHYLEVSYDLSEVMFIATANSLDIPRPLLDRLEVIRISGYTENEKVEIAKNYLLPKQIKEHGLHRNEIELTDPQVFTEIIRSYTREAGVRQLNRELAKICRKTLKQIISSGNQQSPQKPAKSKTKIKDKISIGLANLSDFLGVKRFDHEQIKTQPTVGEVNGLAWTESGGELLTIESIAVPGKGKAIYTGQLGEVMQESIQAAITVLRTLGDRLGLTKNFYEKWDLHVHVPDGATPKDGPSAGVTMCVALVSTFTKIPVRNDIAMTGEINLAGEVLPIGGLKEKLLAAQSAGIKRVFIPDRNKRDLAELPSSLLEVVEIVPVQRIEEILQSAFVQNPLEPTTTCAATAAAAKSKRGSNARPAKSKQHKQPHKTKSQQVKSMVDK